MENLDGLYLVAAGFGFIYIIGTAAIGMANSSADGSGDFSGDSGDLSGADSGDLNGADSGDYGGADGDLSNLETAVVRTSAASIGTGLAHRPHKRSIILLILKLISPSTVATFAFFFGLSGYFLLKYAGFLGGWTLIPATIIGVGGCNAMSAFTSALFTRMHVSNTYSNEQLIGKIADVTVPITPGKLGEITYLGSGGRGNAPARAADKTQTFHKNSQVVITDVSDGIFAVAAWRDEFIDFASNPETVRKE